MEIDTEFLTFPLASNETQGFNQTMINFSYIDRIPAGENWNR